MKITESELKTIIQESIKKHLIEAFNIPGSEDMKQDLNDPYTRYQRFYEWSSIVDDLYNAITYNDSIDEFLTSWEHPYNMNERMLLGNAPEEFTMMAKQLYEIIKPLRDLPDLLVKIKNMADTLSEQAYNEYQEETKREEEEIAKGWEEWDKL